MVFTPAATEAALIFSSSFKIVAIDDDAMPCLAAKSTILTPLSYAEIISYFCSVVSNFLLPLGLSLTFFGPIVKKIVQCCPPQAEVI